MNVSDGVKLFVVYSKELCRLLRREGRDLSDIDLHMLRVQLHVLEMEANNLQTYREIALGSCRLRVASSPALNQR